MRVAHTGGTPSLLNSTESTETMSKLSMNETINQWDDSKPFPTDSAKLMDEGINQDQLTNEETIRGTINPNMIRTPWTSMLSPQLSMR